MKLKKEIIYDGKGFTIQVNNKPERDATEEEVFLFLFIEKLQSQIRMNQIYFLVLSLVNIVAAVFIYLN